MKLNVDLLKLDDAIKKIEKYSEEKQEAIRKTVADSTKNIENNAKEKVKVLSGDTKESIKSEISKDELTGTIASKKPKGFKSHWLEFGTVNMPAKPFLNPSFDEELSKYMGNLKKELDKL
jgi:HK97 gp10 family phage protein